MLAHDDRIAAREGRSADAELGAGEHVRRILVEGGRDLTALYDLERRVLHVSGAVEGLLGRNAEALRRCSVAELVHPDDAPAVVSALARVLRCERAVSARARVADRYGRWIELDALAIPVPDALGAPASILLVGQDVTDSRRTLEVLAESERSYRLLMEQAADAIAITDAAGTMVSANTRACALLGYAREELVGRNLRELVAPHDLELAGFEHVEGGDGQLVELDLRCRSGELVRVEVSATALDDGRVLAIIRDLSERRRREGAEREFVINAAHDLRTPLAGIAAALEVLEAGAKDTPEDRDHFLEDIGRETARLGRLVRALLLLALVQTYQEALQLDRVRLAPLLHDVARSIPVGPEVTVAIDCPAELAALSDPDLLERIVSNLLTNASANTETGTITLAGRPLGNGLVEIQVADTGLGIAADEHDRVFDRFYRAVERDGEGFGLGLSIVRETVRALGGTLELESTYGQGTTVRVALPAPANEEGAA